MTSPKIYKPLFILVIKHFHTKNSTLDIIKICIKNSYFFKINFQGFSSVPHSARIIKRNLKYLKATKNCRFKSSASFYKSKLAIKVEDYGAGIYFAPLPIHRIVDDATQDAALLLRKLTLNGLSSKYLSLKLASFIDFTNKNSNLRELKNTTILKLSNLHRNKYIQPDKRNGEASPQILQNLSLFTHLRGLFLEIAHPGCTSKTFYEVLETVSETSNLKYLKVRMNISKVNSTKYQDFNKIVENFDELNYLCLQFSFAVSFEDLNSFFSDLGSFPALKYLSLELFSRTPVLKYYNAIKFVSLQENLQTLKFKTFHIAPDQYAELFKNVQKMTCLTNLCIVEKDKYPMRFNYGIVIQTLEALKSLKSLKLHLGYYELAAGQMKMFLKVLSSHPALEKVDISMKMDRMSKRPYDFDEEFYQSIIKLKEKLWSFKVIMVIFTEAEYDDVYQKICKIIIPNGKANKRFACERKDC